jgi:hypothetical protein
LLSFRTKLDERRSLYLRLAGDIERQLRGAYDRLYKTGEATQSSLAAKLKVNRSVVHRRLSGRSNMRISTLADMVWALGQNISVNIYPGEAASSGAFLHPSSEIPVGASNIIQFPGFRPGQVHSGNLPPVATKG